MPVLMKPQYLFEKVSEELKKTLKRAVTQKNDFIFKNKKVMPQVRIKASDLSGSLYLDVEKLKSYQVNVTDTGKLVDQNGTQLCGNYIYAMSNDKKLYAARLDAVAHHSYFLSGEKVICAGMLAVNRSGLLKAISNESGHYKPDFSDLIAAANVMKNTLKQTQFKIVDHAAISRNGGYAHQYDSDALLDGNNNYFSQNKNVFFKQKKTKSRSGAQGLQAHMSGLYKTAHRHREALQDKQKTEVLSKIEAQHLLLCNKVLSHSSFKNLIEDFEASKKTYQTELRSSDPSVDESGYVIEFSLKPS